MLQPTTPEMTPEEAGIRSGELLSKEKDAIGVAQAAAENAVLGDDFTDGLGESSTETSYDATAADKGFADSLDNLRAAKEASNQFAKENTATLVEAALADAALQGVDIKR